MRFFKRPDFSTARKDFTTPITFQLHVVNQDGTTAYRGQVDMTMNETCTVHLKEIPARYIATRDQRQA